MITFTFLVLGSAEPMFSLSIFMALLAGFAIRIGIEWSNNKLTLKSVIIQVMFTMSLCYIGLYAWRDLEIKVNVIYYAFGVSLFSVFIVGLLDKIGKVGLTAYARSLIKNILASETKEDEEANKN